MTDYTGSQCPVCKEKFTKDDDIVVCPQCGTPYHRECYKKAGKCINDELHKNGGTWEPDVKRNIIFITEIVCPNCGTKNTPLNFVCENCGTPLSDTKNYGLYHHTVNSTSAPDDIRNRADYDANFYNKNEFGRVDFQPYLINFSDPLCGYNPEEDYEGVKLSELGDYVETNTHYYLPIFKKIKETGRALTWNFTAMLFPELYFSNRKMPLTALIFLVIKLLMVLPDYILWLNQNKYGYLTEIAEIFNISSPAFQTLKILATIIGYAIMFFSGGFANWIYYKHTLKKVSKLKEKFSGPDLSAKLRKKGGTSGGLLALFICIYALPISVFYIYAVYFVK